MIPPLRARLAGTPEAVAASLGGGVAAAYVFVHLLPELASGNEEVAEVLEDTAVVTPVGELLLFLLALVGFLVLYGLDHAAAAGRSRDGLLAVHVGVFAVYNALITYTLPTRFEADGAIAVLFVLAMGLHFLLTDRGLAEHHGRRFARYGRPVLVAALGVGYLLAWLFAPTRTLVVSVLLATLGGFVLYNVFSDEIPSRHRTRFPVFAGSATAYAMLLVAVTVAAP